MTLTTALGMVALMTAGVLGVLAVAMTAPEAGPRSSARAMIMRRYR